MQCSWHCRTYIAERSAFQDLGLDKLENPESHHGIRWLHNELLDWKGNIASGFHVKSPSRNDWPKYVLTDRCLSIEFVKAFRAARWPSEDLGLETLGSLHGGSSGAMLWARLGKE